MTPDPYVNNDVYIEPGLDGMDEPAAEPSWAGLLDLCFERIGPQWVPRADISADLPEDTLASIANRINLGYELDVSSNADDVELWDAAMRCAMQVMEEKTDPWPGAANIKWPLLTEAAIQFNARAYPELVRPFETVVCRVVGADTNGMRAARAERVSRHMSWQLSEQMEGWEADTDKLLIALPIVGCLFRKVWFDPARQANVSEIVQPQDLVINHDAKSLESARRVTHKLTLYKNEVEEYMRSGIWRTVELSLTATGFDDDPAHEFLECHTWHDLDEDGYQEPYCITLHVDTQKIVRIYPAFDPVVSVSSGYGKTKLLTDTPYQQNAVRKAGIVMDRGGRIQRIWRIPYFSKYGFMPTPDGSFYDTGLARLLYPVNEAANSLMNQMLDAGTLSNAQGGFFLKGARMPAGPIRLRRGEFRPLDLNIDDINKGLWSPAFPGPSAAMFQLFGSLLEAGKAISTSKDVLSGETMGKNASPTTTLAIIEQGLKVFGGAYSRILRAMRDEFRLLYRLNRIYMEPEEYFQVLNEQQVVAQQDYFDDLDVAPAADPKTMTDLQRIGKAQALMQWAAGNPLANQVEVSMRYLQALNVSEPEKLITPPNNQPPPDYLAKLDEIAAKIKKMQEEALTIRADTLLKLAQMGLSAPQLASDSEQLEAVVNGTQQGTVGGMVGQPASPPVSQIPPGAPPGSDGGLGGGPPVGSIPNGAGGMPLTAGP